MYLCKMKFILVGKSERLFEKVKNTVLPEDCELEAKYTQEINAPVTGVDTVAIFDGLDSYKSGAGFVSGNSSAVLIINGETASEIGADIRNSVRDIWIMSEDISLADFYLSRLAESVKTDFDFRVAKICASTAFDSIPDLVWFKDIKGRHLAVNDGFCDAVAKTKEQIYKQGHYYIWDIPKEEYEQGDYVCLESEEIVINAGKTCLFDEKVKTKKGMRQFKTYKSPLYDIDGSLFGTCGVANDVTTVHNINSELEVVLDSIPFAILVENGNSDVVTVNSQFKTYFPAFDSIIGISSVPWKDAVLKGHENDRELTVSLSDGEHDLIFFEQPVFSIFQDEIGHIFILNDVTEEHRNQQQTVINANTDFLTGLNNRRHLFSHFNNVKTARQLSLITLDLDNFKNVNDTYGHHVGDKALVETARLMKNCFRDDYVARLGGDEFLIVISRDCGKEQICREAEDFLNILVSHFKTHESFTDLGASAGIAIGYVEDGKEQDYEKLMRRSDKALYTAKDSGKGKCCLYPK